MTIALNSLGRRQRGAALITAVLVVTLASVAAVAMVTRQRMDLRLSENVLYLEQAALYLGGAEAYVMPLLTQDLLNNNKFDNLEEYGENSVVFPVEGGVLTGRVEDLQGRFNINNLLDDKGKRSDPDYQLFKRMLEHLELPPDLADAVVDWLDADEEARGIGGAEDNYYLGMPVAYRTANQPLRSTSELLLVRGFGDRLPDSELRVYDMVEPFVVALPGRTRVNVNTADSNNELPPGVLASVLKDISLQDAQDLRQGRTNEGWETRDQFLQESVLAGKVGKDADRVLDVASNYFLLTAEAQVGRARSTLYTLLNRSDDGKVSVVLRSYGGL
ncbi:MAG: type II secretion system minor pseudopilin GspK [Pseudomonadota bacterium]|nr:MAG: type II secretion system minor pseudopilin GspK [Pseudomonadota bacterium]